MATKIVAPVIGSLLYGALDTCAADTKPTEHPTLESAAKRAALPKYKIIPAAQDAQTTPAIERNASHRAWSRSNSDSSNTRYSSLSQINRNNVGQLELAWEYRSGDGKGGIQANPVIVDGMMYAPTAGGNIVAINAGNGREVWRFHPRISTVEGIGYGPATRGLVYWDGEQRYMPRLFFISNGYLFAVDPKTGKIIDTFGQQGKVSSTKGAGTTKFLGAVAPAIYRDVIVAPNQNVVDAFDVVTGVRLWHFNTLQYPVADPQSDNGGNVWGGIAMDTQRGIAFVATGDPHPNFVGIDRPGDNPHTNSILALDARTGKLLWSFQDVAHNLWDLDISAPPNLVTIKRAGKRIDAVAQVTKMGNTLLLDRQSGKPLFNYRLRRAPVSQIPGERTQPYQPDLELPQPFARQAFTIEDVTNITPESRAFVLQRVTESAFGWFEPPREDKPLIFFGVHGGAEWTGASFDPSAGWLFVSANDIAWIELLSRVVSAPKHNTRRGSAEGEAVYRQYCAACHGEDLQGKGMIPQLQTISGRLSQSQVIDILHVGRNSMPPVSLADKDEHDLLTFLFDLDITRGANRMADDSRSAAYVPTDFTRLLDNQGYPGSKPPWGTLNAIDLNTGKLVWKVPLGEYEELTRRGIPPTGTENFGGSMVTAGGLVFCAGTRDLKIRAFDKENGKELWEYKLPYGGYAPPATYEVNGRQYVVIAATGGGKLGGETGDAYVAFALPRQILESTRPKH